MGSPTNDDYSTSVGISRPTRRWRCLGHAVMPGVRWWWAMTRGGVSRSIVPGESVTIIPIGRGGAYFAMLQSTALPR